MFHNIVQVKWLHKMQKGCHPQAFRYACMEGHIETAKWLQANCPCCREWILQNSTATLAVFMQHWRQLDSLGVGGHLEMLKWLLEDYDIGDTLHCLIRNAVISGSQECLEFLIAQPERYHKMVMESRGDSKKPPLMKLAVEHDRLQMLPVLATISGTQPTGNSFCFNFSRHKAIAIQISPVRQLFALVTLSSFFVHDLLV